MEKRLPVITIILLLAISSAGYSAYVFQEQQKPRKVTRVKRPEFKKRDWDGIYFEDLFAEGLVGERPKVNPPSIAVAQQTPTQSAPSENVAASDKWSALIAGSVLEDETKKILQQLQSQVTTPTKFKTDYRKARQSFSMLSFVFGVIRDYDGDVRWKNYASIAQAEFARSAVVSREGSTQAYENAKSRRDQLTDLVRGGSFTGNEKPPEELDWSTVVDRSPLMKRLQTSYDTLKPLLASKKEFEANVETVFHEASMIAAMGRVLCFEEMEDGDEDDYVEMAESMYNAATQIVQACKTQNYDLAEPALSKIDASCQDCHGEFR